MSRRRTMLAATAATTLGAMLFALSPAVAMANTDETTETAPAAPEVVAVATETAPETILDEEVVPSDAEVAPEVTEVVTPVETPEIPATVEVVTPQAEEPAVADQAEVVIVQPTAANDPIAIAEEANNTVRLQWTAIEGTVRYDISLTDVNGVAIPASASTPNTSYLFTPAALVSNTTYNVVVNAVDAAGNVQSAGVAEPFAYVGPDALPPATLPENATDEEIASASRIGVTSLDMAQEFTVTFPNLAKPIANEWLYSYLVLPDGSAYDLSWARVQLDLNARWYFGSDLPNGAYPMVVQSPADDRVWSGTAVVWNGVGPNPGAPEQPEAPSNPEQPSPEAPEQPQAPVQPEQPVGEEGVQTPENAPQAGVQPQGGLVTQAQNQDVNRQFASATGSSVPEAQLARTGVEVNTGLLAAFALALLVGGAVAMRFQRRTI